MSSEESIHRIYEGFLNPIDEDENSTSSVLTNLLSNKYNNLICASWNTQNDFLHITATPKPFRIYFDEIISAKQNSKETLKLVTFLLKNQKRIKEIFEVCFKDFANFERDFQKCLTPKIAPNMPTHFNAAKKSTVLVLINPFSGQKKALDFWLKHVQPIFKIAEIPYEIGTTSRSGHAIQIVQEISLNNYGAIAVVSGDGLVAEVITGLLTRSDRNRALKLPILHIPGGTGNGLAASVAFQSNEPFPPRGVFCKEMALMLANNRPRFRPLRLYHVETSENGHKQMFMSMNWGLVADIDLGSERFRWAGLIRYHIEAFIRIAKLPTVACYHGKISYLKATNSEEILRKTMFKAQQSRTFFEQKKKDVENFEYYSSEEKASNNNKSTIEEAFQGTHLVKGVPSLKEPLPSDWTIIESEFVFVNLTSMSHMGSDLPYIPSSTLEEEIFYLSFVDWRTLKSRFHMAHLLINMNRCAHLNHFCFQIIPVLGCRVEPAPGAGGYVALDGEACTSGSAFQVVSTSLQATVVSRQARKSLN